MRKQELILLIIIMILAGIAGVCMETYMPYGRIRIRNDIEELKQKLDDK